ncbi:hypothetical protein ACIBHY_29785 [Nonomuraea sp. NPDC050547]|uniref:hypothetical protein n=1 Tax=Nonomuraea sp. NPDC050547 TaxID=3364368 RepID=UPI0037933901
MIYDLLATAFLFTLGALVTLLGVLVTVVCTTCSDLIKQEAATRLERLPLWLLHRAAQDLPEEIREQVLNEEWIPDLLHMTRDTEGLPITRVVRGVRHATNLMGSPAAAIGKMVKPHRRQTSTLGQDTDEPESFLVSRIQDYVRDREFLVCEWKRSVGAVILAPAGLGLDEDLKRRIADVRFAAGLGNVWLNDTTIHMIDNDDVHWITREWAASAVQRPWADDPTTEISGEEGDPDLPRADDDGTV